MLAEGQSKETAGQLPAEALGGVLSPDGGWVAALKPVKRTVTEYFPLYESQLTFVQLATGQHWETDYQVYNSNSLIWEPHGRYLATRSNRQVCVWDPVARSSNCLKNTSYGMTWSPDGKTLVLLEQAGTRSDYPADVVLIDWPAGTQRQRFAAMAALLGPMGTNAPFYPAYSPDGTRLVIPRGIETWIINANTGETLQKFPDKTHTHLRPARWSPDGRYVAIANELIDLKDNIVKQIPALDTVGISQLAWSPDGKRLVLQADESYPQPFAWAWYDPATEKGSNGDPLLAPLGFRPDGQLMTVERTGWKP